MPRLPTSPPANGRMDPPPTSDPTLLRIYDYNKQFAKPMASYTTHLPPDQERAYHAWLADTSQKVGRPLQPDDPTYDMRGFFKKVGTGKLSTGLNAEDNTIHFPDTFKTPYHPTFSNESRFALPTAPSWGPDGRLYESPGRLSLGYRLGLR